ncbi:unnamed protein product [Protopolystoma xenopodis]|uniref:Uncharacterized protein n=1 Tax=Protopolystoma xenopodis TaxID=117903 RepID=A0A448X206_9PLAT|nr:unnamed protein product [Protopolystoma xenopodis]
MVISLSCQSTSATVLGLGQSGASQAVSHPGDSDAKWAAIAGSASTSASTTLKAPVETRLRESRYGVPLTWRAGDLGHVDSWSYMDAYLGDHPHMHPVPIFISVPQVGSANQNTPTTPAPDDTSPLTMPTGQSPAQLTHSAYSPFFSYPHLQSYPHSYLQTYPHPHPQTYPKPYFYPWPVYPTPNNPLGARLMQPVLPPSPAGSSQSAAAYQLGVYGLQGDNNNPIRYQNDQVGQNMS